MSVIVSAVEADLQCDPYADPGNIEATSQIGICDAAGDNFVFLRREVDATLDRWQYSVTGGGWTNITGVDGTGRIEIAVSGSDLNWEVFIDTVSKASGTITGGASVLWDSVEIALYTNPSSTSARNMRILVTHTGLDTEWLWSSSAELDDWGDLWGLPKPRVTGGYTTPDTGQTAGYLLKTWGAPPQLSATLVAPGIYRRAVSFAGDMETFYEASAATHVLAGSGDLHPELLALNASSAALALVLERGGNTVYSIGGGAEAAGAWGTVQTIRTGREKPCGCVLEPTHDLFVVDIVGSTNIAYGQRLSFNGTSFDIGSEVTVSSGDVADERGFVVWNPARGRLLFAYANTSGAVVAKTSDDCGATWA